MTPFARGYVDIAFTRARRGFRRTRARLTRAPSPSRALPPTLIAGCACRSTFRQPGHRFADASRETSRPRERRAQGCRAPRALRPREPPREPPRGRRATQTRRASPSDADERRRFPRRRRGRRRPSLRRPHPALRFPLAPRRRSRPEHARRSSRETNRAHPTRAPRPGGRPARPARPRPSRRGARRARPSRRATSRRRSREDHACAGFDPSSVSARARETRRARRASDAARARSTTRSPPRASTSRASPRTRSRLSTIPSPRPKRARDETRRRRNAYLEEKPTASLNTRNPTTTTTSKTS